MFQPDRFFLFLGHVSELYDYTVALHYKTHQYQSGIVRQNVTISDTEYVWLNLVLRLKIEYSFAEFYKKVLWVAWVKMFILRWEGGSNVQAYTKVSKILWPLYSLLIGLVGVGHCGGEKVVRKYTSVIISLLMFHQKA